MVPPSGCPWTAKCLRVEITCALSIAALLSLPLALHADDQPLSIFVSPALPSTTDPIVLEISTMCFLNIFPPVVDGNISNLEQGFEKPVAASGEPPGNP